ncbi:MAG TPA: FliM/FliN family flagellar motor switch protein [Solirubrobacteraceae bacterium]
MSEAVQEPQAATEPDGGPPEGAGEIRAARRKPEIRTVDFSQPTKFTAELRRRIVRALAPFCEAFALRLSTELRAPVELAVGESSQLTWSAAKAQLSADAIAVALDVRPIERQLLLGVEPALVAQALECLLGGTAAQATSERKLSEIDWALMRRLLQTMVAHLNPTWRDLGNVELELGEVDLEGDAGVVVPLGEPTFALTIDSRIDGLPSSMSLLIPWSGIEPIASEILGGDRPAEDADPHEGAAVSRGLAGAHVCLRAEVGAVRMPVTEMLALAPGSLLALGEPAEEGVQLFAEGVPLGRARPGLRGTRRAIKLTEAIDPGAGATLKEIGPSGAPPLPTILHPEGEADEPAPARLQRMLGIPVRVWAELGRTTIPLGSALELPPGSVIELDQSAEAAIQLFANGMSFAHGTLQVSGEGEWAVQIDGLC